MGVPLSGSGASGSSLPKKFDLLGFKLWHLVCFRQFVYRKPGGSFCVANKCIISRAIIYTLVYSV